MQAEETRLHRHQHFIAGAQGIEGEQADVRRAIDDAPFVGVADRFQRAAQAILATGSAREDRLTMALAPVKKSYEWCIIDCPPSVGLITFNALKAADEVIVPVETGYFSLHGLGKMMETLEVLKDKCNKQVVIRVLPTLYDTRTKLAREVLSELRAKFREYLMESTVNFNTKLKEAASFGQPITEYDPGSRGYKDFVDLARELMGARPIEVEPVISEKMSRPAELVQRAKQLSQLANFQFGRTVTTPLGASQPGTGIPSTAVATAPAASSIATLAAPAKTTAQKIDEFYGVKQLGDEVMFSVRFETANRVLIAGDFNNWTPESTPMVRTQTGRGAWTMSLPLRPGRYRYRFIVDGKWVTDPNNKYVEANQFGELNNIVEVK